MKKRILATLLVVISILSLVSTAFAVDTGISCSEINFVDGSGERITSVDGSEVTAKVNIKSNTSGKLPVLMVCSFTNNMMNGVWYKVATEPTGEIAVKFTPVAGSTLKASVVDGFKTLNNPSSTAEALKESNEISKIYVNGEMLEGLSSDVDFYAVQVDPSKELDIDVIAKDGGTKIDIEYGKGIPQISKIKATSASGAERCVDLAIYSDPKQLTAPTKLVYKIDGVEYEVEGFDPNVYEYDVILPDNTFYVTFEVQVLMGDVNLKVQDINITGKEIGGVEYIKAPLAAAALEAFDERPMRNNLVPIKNEHTRAIAYIGNQELTDETSKYTVNFKAKQPRLTEFTIPAEVKSLDQYLPAFVSGAAVNNDNGSNVGTDRAWALCNVSENLLGSSMFAICNGADDKNKAENDWNEKNKSGEYFSFTADTAGTLFFVTAKKLTNDEWDVQNPTKISDTIDEKWRFISEGTQLSGDFGNQIARDYIIPDLTYNVNYVTWSEKKKTTAVDPYSGNLYKYGDDAITASLMDQTTSQLSRFMYARTFEAGEKVTIYHLGDVTGRRVLLVKWNLD